MTPHPAIISGNRFFPELSICNMPRLGEVAPDFTIDTTEGTIKFHEWLGDSWALLFSHPKDFTPICTTEMGAVANLKPEFEKRNCKLIGLSNDSVESHKKWALDIEETQGCGPNYPIIGDEKLEVSKLFDMIHPDAEDGPGRTAGDNATIRSVFVIGADKKIKLILTYPMTTGRNFHEILRCLDSMQLTASHKVGTPANWKQGEDVVILPSVSMEEATEKYGAEGFKVHKPYLRTTAAPK
jgi:thioredoxin-dependent peroxiredoxin